MLPAVDLTPSPTTLRATPGRRCRPRRHRSEPASPSKPAPAYSGLRTGRTIWLFVVNTDTANSILYTKFNGTGWTSWAAVPGTETGTQTRNFITGYPTVSSSQVGLAWTQNTATANFDVVATSFRTAAAAAPATVAVTAPTSGSTVTGSAMVMATATPGSGTIAGVQFKLDGMDLGVEDTESPYSISWDTTTSTNGTHFLTAVARDTNGGMGTATTVSVIVTNTRTTPAITWGAPANIVYGTVLDATQLNASATVPGTFTYTPGAGAVLPAGPAQTLSVTFTPSDTINYTTATASVAITVLPATPAIIWPAPASISYGTALSTTQLNASTLVPGTFVYTPASGAGLNAGAHTLSATFTPTDPTSYTTATASVAITVLPAAPTIALTAGRFDYNANPHPATGVVTGVGGAPVAGTFGIIYAPGGSAPPVIPGTYSVTGTFISTDPNYSNGSGTATLTIDRAVPNHTWPTPADIVYGTALGAAQLNMIADTPGTYMYMPPAGTVFSAKNGHVIFATFTPADMNYFPFSKTVSINVVKATPAITWSAPAQVAGGTALSATQLNATANVPGTFVYSPAAGTVLESGNRTLSVTFTPNDAELRSSDQERAAHGHRQSQSNGQRDDCGTARNRGGNRRGRSGQRNGLGWAVRDR